MKPLIALSHTHVHEALLISLMQDETLPFATVQQKIEADLGVMSKMEAKVGPIKEKMCAPILKEATRRISSRQ